MNHGEAFDLSTRRYCAGQFKSVVGREQQGEARPVLVLSSSLFNALGVVLVNMVRSLDLEVRAAKKVEAVPQFVVDDALARLQTILV